MKKDDNTYYVFKCGCEYPVKNCKKKYSEEKNKNRVYVCPEHNDVAVSKYRYCSECGKRVDSIGLQGVARKMHPECARQKAIHSKREKRKRQYNIYLEYPCKCVLTREQSEYGYIKGSGKRGKKGWCCPEHETQAIKRFIYCKKCKKKVYIPLSGKPKEFCDNCVKSKRIKRQRKYLKKQKKNGVKQVRRQVIKHGNLFDCINYEEFCKSGDCVLAGNSFFRCRMFKRAA